MAILGKKAEHCISRLIKIEDPRGDEAEVVVDHAGATKYGITLTHLKRIGDLKYDLDLDGCITLED